MRQFVDRNGLPHWNNMDPTVWVWDEEKNSAFWLHKDGKFAESGFDLDYAKNVKWVELKPENFLFLDKLPQQTKQDCVCEPRTLLWSGCSCGFVKTNKTNKIN